LQGAEDKQLVRHSVKVGELSRLSRHGLRAAANESSKLLKLTYPNGCAAENQSVLVHGHAL